jgi:hypothetical protein
MAKLSKRTVQGRSGHRYMHYCPGCKSLHAIDVGGDRAVGPQWTFDGSMDSPTFHPSIRNFTTYDDDGNPLPAGTDRTLCHYFIKNGHIEFCNDCGEHNLGGQTVPLPEIPPGWFDD